jgi:hypothetical protein
MIGEWMIARNAKDFAHMAKFATVDEYVASLDGPFRDVAAKMVSLIDAAMPDAPGAMWQGHPVWSAGEKPGKQPVALIKAYPKYVTFGLWKGREVDDPDGRIDTSGSMASVKLASVDDIDEALFTGWLKQARALES